MAALSPVKAEMLCLGSLSRSLKDVDDVDKTDIVHILTNMHVLIVHIQVGNIFSL